MSYTITVWAAPTPIDTDEAKAFLERHAEGQTVFAERSNVSAFLSAVLSQFPALEHIPDEEIDDLGVWAATPTVERGCVSLSISPSRVDEVLPVLMELAHGYGLYVFDDQQGEAIAESQEEREARLQAEARQEAEYAQAVMKQNWKLKAWILEGHKEGEK